MGEMNKTWIIVFSVLAGLFIIGLIASANQPQKKIEPAKKQTLLDVSGSGSMQTEKFSSQGDWDMKWEYDCSNIGVASNFIVTPTSDIKLNPLNHLGQVGAGAQHYYQSGEYYLDVLSQCKWRIIVSGVKQ